MCPQLDGDNRGLLLRTQGGVDENLCQSCDWGETRLVASLCSKAGQSKPLGVNRGECSSQSFSARYPNIYGRIRTNHVNFDLPRAIDNALKVLEVYVPGLGAVVDREVRSSAVY